MSLQVDSEYHSPYLQERYLFERHQAPCEIRCSRALHPRDYAIVPIMKSDRSRGYPGCLPSACLLVNNTF